MEGLLLKGGMLLSSESESVSVLDSGSNGGDPSGSGRTPCDSKSSILISFLLYFSVMFNTYVTKGLLWGRSH